MLKKKPLAYDGMDGRASFQCGGVFKGFCLFSNDWKLLLKKFQSLETFLTIFLRETIQDENVGTSRKLRE
ncbi:MAG: hypothetical protein PHP44_01520 [Kiritimatiellae bacterium]|nr:hypothetical protein [Kiritimatiellia bacterium]